VKSALRGEAEEKCDSFEKSHCAIRFALLFSAALKLTYKRKNFRMGSIKKRRKSKINRHKRKKRMKLNRHKKRLRYKS
jgi:hypothetical protein